MPQQETPWQAELNTLRQLLLDQGLDETVKWRSPCFMINNKNVALLNTFQDHCVLSFFKGALLRDPHGLLVAPGENTRAARIIRFSSVDQIRQHEAALRAYIDEAIEIERSGAQVDFAATRAAPLPEELTRAFAEDPSFQAAFEGLTPGRQRAYLLHFGAAKQAKTRTARIARYRARILDGKGINDCVCGLSKRMPGCDGSHKHAPQR